MKFKKYISEKSLVSMEKEIYEYWVSRIQKDCKPYLSLLKGKRPLLRGIDKIGDVGIKGVRKDRIPSGSNRFVFDYVNKWLDKKGYPRRDRSVMCRSSDYQMELFGNPYYIYPKGNFKYAWVDVKDFNEDEDDWNLPYHGISSEDDLLKDDIDKTLEKHITANKGFDIAYKKDYEIWIECSQYYYISLFADFDWGNII